MATRWVDLDKVDTGDGLTPETAWNGDQAAAPGGYIDTLNDQQYIYKTKGSYTFAITSSITYYGQFGYGHTIEPWDASLYGPWRINITGNYVLGWRIPINKGGIFNAYYMYIVNSQYITNYYYGCFFILRASLNILSRTYYYGCFINIGTEGIRVLYLNPNSEHNKHFIDCLIAGTDNGSSSFVYDPTPIYPNTFTRCAISTASLPVSAVVTECQINWTKPTTPSWDAGQSSFDMSLFIQNVNKPLPYTGTSPYTGYDTGLWGLSRYSIGTGWFLPPVAGTGVGIEFNSDIENDDGTGIEFEAENTPGTGVGVEFSVDL